MPPTDTTTTAPQQAPAPGAFDVVEGGATPRLRLRARDLGAAEVELGIVARADRRLLVAVHPGRTYVGIAPDAPPARGRGHRRRDRAGRPWPRPRRRPALPRRRAGAAPARGVGHGRCRRRRRRAPPARRREQPVPRDGRAVRPRRRRLPRADPARLHALAP